MKNYVKIGRIATSSIALIMATSIAPSSALAEPGIPAGEPTIVEDDLGVNLMSGSASIGGTAVSVGLEGSGGLTFRTWLDLSSFWRDNMRAYLSNVERNSLPPGLDTVGVSSGNSLGRYAITGGSYPNASYTPVIEDGSSLTLDLQKNFVMIQRDGKKVSSNFLCKSPDGRQMYDNMTSYEVGTWANKVENPNGEILRVYFITLYGSDGCEKAHRIQSMKNNFGYQIHFDYATEDIQSIDWDRVTAVTAINKSVDYCGDTAIRCLNMTKAWPSVQFSEQIVNLGNNYSYKTMSYVDSVGKSATVRYDYAPGFQYQVTLTKEGAELAKYTALLSTPRTIEAITKGGKTWTYSHFTPDPFEIWSVAFQRTSPLGGVKAVQSEALYGQVRWTKDEQGNVTKYFYDANHLLTHVLLPEGSLDANGNPAAGYTKYDYDARANVIKTTVVAKAGSGLANIVTSAGFDTTCSNRKTCNQPNWTRDADANQLDPAHSNTALDTLYSYSPDHGGVLSVMGPAPVSGAARPLKLNTYAQRYAWVKNASGTLVQLTDPVWLIATSTQCQTVAGGNSPVCDTAAPQTVTTFEYGASGTGEAMLVKGVAISSGGTTMRTCFGYDYLHRRISETKPNANLTSCQ